MARINKFNIYIALLISLLVAMGIHTLSHSLQAADANLVFRKDFLQDYLLAKAASQGDMPYENISTLKERYFPENMQRVFDHPSPHPPTVIPLLLPLSKLDYQTSAIIWTLLTFMALGLSAYLIFQHLKDNGKQIKFWLIALLTLGADPVRRELVTGQYNAFVLLLMLLLIRAVNKEAYKTAGLCLGMSLVLKLFGVFIFCLFILKKQWQILIYATAVFLGFLGLSCSIVGIETVYYYFNSVAPLLKQTYATSDYNISLFSLGNRLFLGTDSTALIGIKIAPFILKPEWAGLATVAIVISAVIFAFYLMVKNPRIENQIALAILANIILSPVSWLHSLVIAACPLAIAYSQTEISKKPNFQFYFVVFLIFTGGIFQALFTENGKAYGFYYGLVTLIPTLAIIFLALILAKKKAS